MVNKISPGMFTLTSPAFRDGEDIPSLYTCEGEDISPPLSWQNSPKGTKSYVLIMEDPDAPGQTWDHWILFNIPPTIYQLSENIASLPPGTKVGLNSWNKSQYGGPCPPQGKHRYIFTLYALDTLLDREYGASKATLLKVIAGHILAKAILVGNFAQKIQA